MFRNNLWKKYLVIFGLEVIVAYLFYGRIWLCIIGVPILFFLKKEIIKTEEEKKQQEYIKEFADFLQIMDTALATGYSLEHGIAIAGKELEQRYGRVELVRDLKEIEKQVALHVSVEELLLKWAEYRQIEEIKFFVQIIIAGRKRGGDVNRMIRQTAENLSSRLECEAQIQTLLSGKYLEYRVMSLMPLGVIAYVKIGSSSYFDAVYESVGGIIFMTICLGIYMVAVWIGRKWIRVKD